MCRKFFYARVSTREQTTANQVDAAKLRGHTFEPHRIIEEQISGSVEAFKRPKFKKLVCDQMEAGDHLFVSKIDRLGRDSVDIQLTLKRLATLGIKITLLDLADQDLLSPAGKMFMQLLTIFAEFERNKIIERTQDGLARAKAEGKTLGRPFGSKNTESIELCKQKGLNKSQTAKHLGIGLSTVRRNWGE